MSGEEGDVRKGRICQERKEMSGEEGHEPITASQDNSNEERTKNKIRKNTND